MESFQSNFLQWLLIGSCVIGLVQCGYVYFYNYFPYTQAYTTCKTKGMRLLRVENEEKLQKIMDFTHGFENFTISTSAFLLSLRYDVTSSSFKWPDGTVNSLLSNWASGELKAPESKQCVAQYGGQNNKFGLWKTVDCDDRTTFICESGYSLDPSITGEDPDSFIPDHRSFTRLPPKQTGIITEAVQIMTEYDAEESTGVTYKGFREFLIEACAVWCTVDPICTGIVYTTNKNQDNNVCILLK